MNLFVEFERVRQEAIGDLVELVHDTEARLGLTGCCTDCDGHGRDPGSPDTGGRCWSCYGTGHPHSYRERC